MSLARMYTATMMMSLIYDREGRGGAQMKRIYGSVIIVMGGLVSLVAFFLPWVEADFVTMTLPLIQNAAGLLNQELKVLIAQFADYSSVTGFDLAFRLDFVTTTTRFIAMLPSLLALIALAALILTFLNAQLSHLTGSVLVTLAILTTAILVYSMPSLIRLGLAGNWLTSTALALLGFAPTIGFWGALVGTIMIGIGGGLLLMTGSGEWSSNDVDGDYYDTAYVK